MLFWEEFQQENSKVDIFWTKSISKIQKFWNFKISKILLLINFRLKDKNLLALWILQQGLEEVIQLGDYGVVADF